MSRDFSRSDRRVAWLAFACCPILALPARAVQGPPLVVHPQAELSGVTPVSNGAFGYALDQDGTSAVVGEPFNGPGGAAHVLSLGSGGWVAEQELRAQDAQQFDYFGASVAIDGDTLVVGAYGVEPNFSGAVYVFERLGGTWVETAKLHPSNGGSSDFFGLTVDVDGERIAVGSPDHAGGSFLSGAVYVFARQSGSWVEEAYLVGSPPDAGLRIGNSLALDGDTVVGGGLCSVAGLAHAGCAFVWTRGVAGWVQQQKLEAPSPTPGEDFGNGLALAGDRLAAGGAGALGGAAYVLERSAGTWFHVAKLTSSQRWAGAQLGRRLDFDGERLLASGLDTATLFSSRSGTWTEHMLLVPVDWAGGYAWGGACMGAGRVLFGIPGASLEAAPQCGLVMDYDLAAQGVPLGRRYCDPAVPNSTGNAGVLVVGGSASAADDLLTLAASFLPPGDSGFFLFGLGQGSVLPASSVGPLCIAGSLVVRVPASLQDASAFGTIHHVLGTLSVPVVGAFRTGETWNFQAWYRDDVSGLGNLTDAVEVDFH